MPAGPWLLMLVGLRIVSIVGLIVTLKHGPSIFGPAGLPHQYGFGKPAELDYRPRGVYTG